MKAIQQVYGQTAFGNSAAMRTMGEEVGALLVQNCPTSMGYFMAMAGEHDGAKSSATTTGQLGSLSGPGVTLLAVQASPTEKVYFARIRHFDQANDLLRRLPQLQGQRAHVSWEEVEILQPDTRQYQKVREITGIELL